VLKIYKGEHLDLGQQVNIILCSDRKIRSLNAGFRHKDRVTDVLAFNYGEPDLLGEIYISLQRAEIQSRKFRHSLNEEIKRLVTHGMFHLLGYDHRTKSAEKAMNAKESLYCRI